MSVVVVLSLLLLLFVLCSLADLLSRSTPFNPPKKFI